ncbi:Maf-like protein [Gramella sp. AN32]|uniref:dTTP/UTP pyrophosphatase n=1 Tax=Christiangramia antarctica TaxID=2058158 RepID=A0ABW5X9B0_9FLAO|nr:Maf-like protein [Gramella sp. AN32]MCM4156049.1 septum formation protein Maf [Gramella sp. AN32]
MLKEILKDHEIILASGSPRRQKFFKDLDIPFTITLNPVEEIFPDHLKAEEITDFLAELKAEAFQDSLKQNQILITSDTIVYLDNLAMGKPKDFEDACTMLRKLSGKSHDVISSVTFTTSDLQKTLNHTTKVYFKNISEEEIQYYVKNFEPYDKAGGYAIQEWIGLIGIEKIEGSYNNVVGLPTHLVYFTLKDLLQN